MLKTANKETQVNFWHFVLKKLKMNRKSKLNFRSTLSGLIALLAITGSVNGQPFFDADHFFQAENELLKQFYNNIYWGNGHT
jgi:hypothetical protein